ncbi:hypothetical protein [Nonomuraea sp. NPDC046570]
MTADGADQVDVRAGDDAGGQDELVAGGGQAVAPGRAPAVS